MELGHKAEEQGKCQLLRRKIDEPLALAHGCRVGAELVHQVSQVHLEIGRSLFRLAPREVERSKIGLACAHSRIVRFQVRLLDFERAKIEWLGVGESLRILVDLAESFK